MSNDFLNKHSLAIFSIFFACGIMCYFALGFSIHPIYPLIGISFFLLAFSLRHNFYKTSFVITCFSVFSAGIFIIAFKTHILATPILKTPLKTFISGTIIKSEIFDTHQRITLSEIHTEKGIKLKKIRLNIDKKYQVEVGDFIQADAFLFPPSLPREIGDFNFSRFAFYQKIGATGHIKKLYAVVQTENPSFKVKLENFRTNLRKRIYSIQSPEIAAITIPLILGDQGTVPKNSLDLYRKSGITHVLSVSGFHLTLLACFLFFTIRKGCAFIPILALNINTKKIAAIISFIILFFYLLISGLQIPAIRSFLMISLVFLSIIVNRNVLNLRTSILVAISILIFYPEEILSPSFQLSFIAVFALLSLHDTLLDTLRSPWDKSHVLGKLKIIVFSIFISTFLAVISTTFYSIYHFHSFAPYGFIGNICTTFLFSFLIMPCLLIAVILYFFGLDYFFFKATECLLNLVNIICQNIADLPYSEILVSAYDTKSLVIVTIGWLILFFFTTKFRFSGIILVIIGWIGGNYWYKQPSLIITENKTIGVYQKDWRIMYHKSSHPYITTWFKRSGKNIKNFEKKELKSNFVYINKHKISFSDNSCSNASISFLKVPSSLCKNKTITFKEIKKEHLIQIYPCQHSLCLKGLKSYLGKYPWVY